MSEGDDLFLAMVGMIDEWMEGRDMINYQKHTKMINHNFFFAEIYDSVAFPVIRPDCE
jgi:hypothetical protein